MNKLSHNNSTAINLLKKAYKNSVKKIFPSPGEIMDSFLENELKNCSRILDLGCGPSSPLGRITNKLKPNLYSVGIDNFNPYLEENKQNKIHSEYIRKNILDIDFKDNSFDCVLLIDVVEHLRKEDFLKLLPKLEKISKKIIIITPNGFIEQEEYDNNKYQIHQSGWTENDLSSLNFRCFGMSGLKFLRGKLAVAKIKPLIIGNLICNITEPLIYKKPKYAYHLMCVKNN